MGWTEGIDLSPIFSEVHKNISTKGGGGRLGPGKEMPSTRQSVRLGAHVRNTHNQTHAKSGVDTCARMGIQPHFGTVASGSLSSSGLVP